MSSTAEQLSSAKYLTVKQLVGKEQCAALTAQMKYGLVNNKIKAHVDKQCPRSYAFYCAPFFNRLLIDLLPSVEAISGKQLYPTYSYARLYKPLEVLAVHTDRASCEISVTLTLGFEGGVWPIFMGDADGTNASKIEMDVGDAVVYMGIEKPHWREIYTEGKWQTQVFLHYVDADGPHKEWKFDKQPNLNFVD